MYLSFAHYSPSVEDISIQKVVRPRQCAGWSVYVVLFTFRRLLTEHLTNLHISAVEAVGLAARAYSRDNLEQKKPFIIQLLLIHLAPILFAAAVYMFLGRLIRASGHEKLSIINVGWLTKIFVVGDIFCFFIQAAGAGKLVNAETSSSISTAENIILGGLGLQILFFCFFVLCAAIFHIRVSKQVAKWIDPALRLMPMLWSLYFCSLLITIRNIFRLAEYRSGTGGYLQTHEWPMYGLDVALMALLMVVSFFWYSKPNTSEPSDQYSLTRL